MGNVSLKSRRSQEIREPIPAAGQYSGGMKPHQTSYRFCLEPDAPIATLEQVLAIVRRLDLELRALRTTATPGGVEVLLRLAGQDPEPLTLCRMRLHNLVGVLPIRELSANKSDHHQQRSTAGCVAETR